MDRTRRSANTRTGSEMPLTDTGASACVSVLLAASAWVAAVRYTSPGLAACSILAAIGTVGPEASYSTLSPSPTVRTTTSPECSPTRICRALPRRVSMSVT